MNARQPLTPAADLLQQTPYSIAVAPEPLPGVQRLWTNDRLATELGLDPDWWHSPAATEVLAGAAPWPAPGGWPGGARASVYAGHQFGTYTRQLGDGRALSIATLPVRGGPVELQLKGAGVTPYARGLDGRVVLRAAIREVLGCEALHALGVPTTRALALLGSTGRVLRDDRFEPAALLCRSAPSFVRFGHFEYWAQQPDGARHLAALADNVQARHHPALGAIADPVERRSAWLAEVITAQARLVAQWQVAGFCHGVINTDNCSVHGLTLDYGPYGFLERFRPHHVCNHSDTEGRYAWQAQPSVGEWSCARLLDACLPLLGPTPGAQQARHAELLALYRQTSPQALLSGWCARLGLDAPQPGDAELVRQFLTLLQQGRCDFTLGWRALAEVAPGEVPLALPTQPAASAASCDAPRPLRESFPEPAAFDAWHARWLARLHAENRPAAELQQRLRQRNPWVVLRNHLAQTAIAAAEAGDLRELHALMASLQRPFEAPLDPRHACPAAPEAAPVEVSCSS